MTELEGLVTGTLLGAMLKASEDGPGFDLALSKDDDGAYLPTFHIRRHGTGEVVRVMIEDDPDAAVEWKERSEPRWG